MTNGWIVNCPCCKELLTVAMDSTIEVKAVPELPTLSDQGDDLAAEWEAMVSAEVTPSSSSGYQNSRVLTDDEVDSLFGYGDEPEPSNHRKDDPKQEPTMPEILESIRRVLAKAAE